MSEKNNYINNISYGDYSNLIKASLEDIVYQNILFEDDDDINFSNVSPISSSSVGTIKSLSDMFQKLQQQRSSDDRERTEAEKRLRMVGEYSDVFVSCWVGFSMDGEMMESVRGAYERAGEVGDNSYYVLATALASYTECYGGHQFKIMFSEDDEIWTVLPRHRFNPLHDGGGVVVLCEVKDIGMCDINGQDSYNLMTPIRLNLRIRCGLYGGLAAELLETAGRFCVTGQGELGEDSGKQEILGFKPEYLFYYRNNGVKIRII